MKNRTMLRWLIFLLIINLSVIVTGQDDLVIFTESADQVTWFVRGGFYAGRDDITKDLCFPGAFSDIGFKVESEKSDFFRAFADVRFRFGSEFGRQVNRYNIHEGYVTISGKKWDLSAGQKIIKWGRADFTNPTSKLNPANLLIRSPDREDMDLGNLLLVFDIYPTVFLRLEAVAVPLYRPSVLITDPFPLPQYVSLNNNNLLRTESEIPGYGLKADFHVKGFDWSISWFDGFDPMPGIELANFDLDLTVPAPVPNVDLNVKAYRNRVLGFDFETSAGVIGLRGEAAWSVPELSWECCEYVPLSEVKYAAGADWSSGIWRFTWEYSGKYIPEFKKATVAPLLGSSSDLNELAELINNPAFSLQEYVRLQTGSFNRLYNYQLERIYHSAAFKVEADLKYGKLLPSVLLMYNFVSGDLLVIPEVKIKPADGISLTAGAEYYKGREGSLYNIIDGFMNSFYLSLRADF